MEGSAGPGVDRPEFAYILLILNGLEEGTTTCLSSVDFGNKLACGIAAVDFKNFWWEGIAGLLKYVRAARCTQADVLIPR